MLSRFEQFSSVISEIYRSIQKIERAEMVKFGYKGAFAQYLTAMRRYPDGLTSSQLCEICDKDKAAVSRIVAEMEEKGLVVREGGSAYRARIRMTAEGRRITEFICERAKAAVAAGGRGLTDESRRNFYESLERIASNLENISKEGIPSQ